MNSNIKTTDKIIIWTHTLANDIYKTIKYDPIHMCNETNYIDFNDIEYSANNYKYNCIFQKYGYRIDMKDDKECEDFLVKNVELHMVTPDFNPKTPYSFKLVK